MVGGMPLVSSILTPKRIQHIDAFSKAKKKNTTLLNSSGKCFTQGTFLSNWLY